MKCLKCNSEIMENQTVCPGCGTTVDELRQNNLLLLTQQDNSEESIEVLDESTEVQPVVIPVSEENNEVEIQEVPQSIIQTEPSKKNKMPIMVGILVLVVLLAVVGFSYFVMKAPKSIFTRSINKLYKNTESELKENVKSLSTNFELKFNVDGEAETKEIASIINNITLSGNVDIDYINKLFMVTFNSKYDNDELLDAEVQYQKGSAYVLLNNVFDKYIVVNDMNEMDNYFEKAQITEDHKILITEIKKALINSLKSKFFEKTKTELEINGKKEKVTKNTLKLTRENMVEISKDLLETLKNDDKFLESYSKINDTDVATVKSDIQESIDGISGENFNEDNGEISLYTKGLFNELVELEIVIKDSDETQKMALTKTDNNNYVLRLVTTDNEEIILNIYATKENEIINLKLSTIVENQNISLEMKYGYDYNKEVNLKDVSNNVNINELTEEQMIEIMNKLSQNSGVQKIMQAINEIQNKFDDSQLYDYDIEL